MNVDTCAEKLNYKSNHICMYDKLVISLIESKWDAVQTGTSEYNCLDRILRNMKISNMILPRWFVLQLRVVRITGSSAHTMNRRENSETSLDRHHLDQWETTIDEALASPARYKRQGADGIRPSWSSTCVSYFVIPKSRLPLYFYHGSSILEA